ncbi:unnamed protein product [Brassica oleracea var. botrytis]|uniref:Reverse transcriptase zinc-binding domain-containing protein n=1 Tax=Brassica oleracea var. oleracea TaxID=109376 RepID=A0A0D3BYE9_BRAOL
MVKRCIFGLKTGRLLDITGELARHTLSWKASWPVATVGPDIALWRHDQDVFKLNFSATETWEVELKRPNSHGIVLYGSLRPYPDNPSWFETGSEQGCVYCREKDESRDHLFFACPYTLTKERNSRRRGGVCASVDMTTKVIGKLVKNRISSLKYTGNHQLR